MPAHHDASWQIKMLHHDESPWRIIMEPHDESWRFITMRHDDSSWCIIMTGRLSQSTHSPFRQFHNLLRNQRLRIARSDPSRRDSMFPVHAASEIVDLYWISNINGPGNLIPYCGSQGGSQRYVGNKIGQNDKNTPWNIFALKVRRDLSSQAHIHMEIVDMTIT